ncbi:MAG TPA: response regulator [Thermoanaerobaculia bacterium]
MAGVARRHRALIVEDDAAIRRLLTKMLGRQDISVDSASDGLTAIELLGANAYSVIVLDLMVPGANGFEIIEHLKQSGSSTPVAVVSAVSQRALTDLDLDIVKIVVGKPFDVDELTRAIVSLCEEYGNEE